MGALNAIESRHVTVGGSLLTEGVCNIKEKKYEDDIQISREWIKFWSRGICKI